MKNEKKGLKINAAGGREKFKLILSAVFGYSQVKCIKSGNFETFSTLRNCTMQSVSSINIKSSKQTTAAVQSTNRY